MTDNELITKGNPIQPVGQVAHGWLPIESAPVGLVIMAWRPTWEVPFPAMVYDEPLPETKGHKHVIDPITGDMWKTSHWMPVSPPPAPLTD